MSRDLNDIRKVVTRMSVGGATQLESESSEAGKRWSCFRNWEWPARLKQAKARERKRGRGERERERGRVQMPLGPSRSRLYRSQEGLGCHSKWGRGPLQDANRGNSIIPDW